MWISFNTNSVVDDLIINVRRNKFFGISWSKRVGPITSGAVCVPPRGILILMSCMFLFSPSLNFLPLLKLSRVLMFPIGIHSTMRRYQYKIKLTLSIQSYSGISLSFLHFFISSFLLFFFSSFLLPLLLFFPSAHIISSVTHLVTRFNELFKHDFPTRFQRFGLLYPVLSPGFPLFLLIHSRASPTSRSFSFSFISTIPSHINSGNWSLDILADNVDL